MFFSAAILLVASLVCRDHLVALALPPAPPAPPKNVVDMGFAKFQGNQTYPNSVAYLGIPYAEPPVGDLRFRAPRPLDKARVARETKGKIVDATEYPDFCVQGDVPNGSGSEDCLKVNVYAPTGAKRGDNLPVLVYIHGGGFVYGNPRCWPFEHWVQQSPNVVIVSVYYRLSSFGFLASPALKDGTLGDLNVGFLDQVAALKWVQENIATFGGDPSKVTIDGHSAGGASIQLHLIAKTSAPRPPFRAAIAQSVGRSALPTPEQQQALFNAYATRAGCGEGTDAEKMACLRKASISTLTNAQSGAGAASGSAYRSFKPVVDGKVITDYPTLLVGRGEFAKVQLMVGHTTNETSGAGGTLPGIIKGAYPGLSDAGAQQIVDAYPSDTFASEALRVQTLMGDNGLRCATSILGHAYSATNGLNAFTYRFNQLTPNTVMVLHAAENWFMFRGTAPGPNGFARFEDMNPTQAALGEELIAYWISFVRSGNPNTFKLARSPTWENYSGANTNRMILQATPDGTTEGSGSRLEKETAVDTGRCEVIASLAGQEQN